MTATLFRENAPADMDQALKEIPIIDFGRYFAGEPGALAPLDQEIRAE